MLRLLVVSALALGVVLMGATPGMAMQEPAPAVPPPAEQAPGQPSEQAAPVADLAAYRKALENAKAVIEQLRAELAETQARAATLERALLEAGITPDAEQLASEQMRADREAARLAEEERRRKILEIREQREAEKRQERLKEAFAPAWYYTWQIGYINSGNRQTTFVKTNDDGTVVFVGDKTSVDRRQIILRGTFENLSRAAYRYTFEIRVAESGPYLTGLPVSSGISSTRYQTPVLQPGELHRWEVKMSVNDALQIRTVGIGNVRADPASFVEPNADTDPVTAAPEPTTAPEDAAGS